MTFDPIGTVQVAALGALRAGMLAEHGLVTQHVKQGTLPPFTLVGDVDFERERDDLFLVTFEVISVYRGPGRAPLLSIMNAARTAVLEQPFTAAGATFGRLQCVAGSASQAGPDGVTYAGLLKFEVYAEPA
ncbi:hypothetical protein S2M10_31680 [Sphingomonas sp. S2M10]|uniref:hypothetical protein n=1 Tax=Sphingomonas sp. S2M10 TaxID=2705010 RepID=UPI0014565650|nr:hypothetical protein [Sphingomonas sp. S2M10]NLS28159.1 hypothetical protein [Sphingomonas sp. S2M10]